MAKKKIYFGTNTKMYKTIKDTVEFVSQLQELTKDISREDMQLFVIPSYTTLRDANEAKDEDLLMVGAQNMGWEEQGQFTGEISPLMLQEVGTDIVMIGHSERRHVFGETDVEENKKVKAAHKYGLKPIVCVGETLEQKEAGETTNVITTQTRLALEGLSKEQVEGTIIAYEPIWAIGTGKTATSEDANNSIKAIRKKISEIYGSVAEDVIIQYGGSVKSTNAKELFETSDIDGALVGGASLKVDEFAKIVNYNK